MTGIPLALMVHRCALFVMQHVRATPSYIIVAPNVGVIYTGGKKKLSEHGGFAHDDTTVMMLVSNPGMPQITVNSPVETAQVAPTILALLGLDPNRLISVQQEGTQVLPGLQFSRGRQ